MAEKILNTRIQLKYDTLANWQKVQTTFKPLAGEICIAEVPTVAGSTLQPVMIKIGQYTDESKTDLKTWAQLDWLSAKAADVYGWAKKEKLEFSDIPQEVIEAIKGSTDTNDNTTYAFDIVDGKLQVTETPHVLGVAGTPVTTSYDFVTPAELTTILANYYTKDEVNTELGKKLDKTTYEAYINGKSMSDVELKTYADGQASAAQTAAEATAASALSAARTAITTEIGQAVAPLATTEALNNVDAKFADYTKTADLPKDLGDFTNNAGYAKTDNVVTNDEFTAFEATNTQAIENAAKAGTDAAAAVLGTATDAATANTVYGAKAAAAAAQSDATTAKTKIEAFLGTITPDGANDVIDTLAEVQAELDRLGDAVELEQQFATKVDKTVYEAHLTAQDTRDNGQDEKIAALEGKFDSEGKALNADKLDGKDSNDFATAAQGTKADTAAATIATYGDIVTHDADEFATAAQGTKADNSVQYSENGADVSIPGTLSAEQVSVGQVLIDGGSHKIEIGYSEDNDGVEITGTDLHFAHMSGDAHYGRSGFSLDNGGISNFAIIAESTEDNLVVDGSDDVKASFNEFLGTQTIAEAAAEAAAKEVEAKLPTSADYGVLSVTANDTEAKKSGIKVDNTDAQNPKVEIDDTIVWIFNCGNATI